VRSHEGDQRRNRRQGQVRSHFWLAEVVCSSSLPTIKQEALRAWPGIKHVLNSDEAVPARRRYTQNRPVLNHALFSRTRYVIGVSQGAPCWQPWCRIRCGGLRVPVRSPHSLIAIVHDEQPVGSGVTHSLRAVSPRSRISSRERGVRMGNFARGPLTPRLVNLRGESVYSPSTRAPGGFQSRRQCLLTWRRCIATWWPCIPTRHRCIPTLRRLT
jgi:hypothetical protein